MNKNRIGGGAEWDERARCRSFGEAKDRNKKESETKMRLGGKRPQMTSQLPLLARSDSGLRQTPCWPTIPRRRRRPNELGQVVYDGCP